MPAAVMSLGRYWQLGGSEERLLLVAFLQVSGFNIAVANVSISQ